MEFRSLFPYDGGMRKIPAFLLMILMSLAVGAPSARAADTDVYIPVGQAKIKKTILAFPDIRSPGDSSLGAYARQISETVKTDLTFMDLFSFLPNSAFLEDASKSGLTSGT